MKLTVDSFVMKLFAHLGECRYFYKETVYGGIKCLRDRYGYYCDATDDEIYDCFRTAWSELIG